MNPWWLVESILRQPDVQVTFLASLAVTAPALWWVANRLDGRRDAAVGAAAGLSIVVATTLVREGGFFRINGDSLAYCIANPGLRIDTPERLLNVLLFSPFAFFAVLAIRRSWPVLPAALGVSAALEAVQSLTGRGVCEAGDLTRNLLGATVAVALAAVIDRRGRPASVPRNPGAVAGGESRSGG